MILQAAHTHLYPGLRGEIFGPAPVADRSANADCLVEFIDGSAAPATISPAADDWLLATAAYRSAAGTDIAAKRWLVRIEEVAGRRQFRILKKLPGPANLHYSDQ